MTVRSRLATLIVAVFAAVAMAQETADLSTPRSTVATLLAAVRDERWDIASATLDLSEIPAAQRATQGKVAAAVIVQVLQTNLVDPSDLSDSPEGGPVTVARIRPNPTVTAIPIILARSREAGWQFSAETIARISEIQAALTTQSSSAGDTSGSSGSSPSSTISKSAADLVGQISGVKPPSSGSSSSAEKVAAGLSSPQATMSTYLTAMNDGDIPTAVTTLDLSQINPVIRADEGAKAANLLFAILNRTEYIDVKQLPIDPESVTYTYWTYRNRLSGELVGEIVLAQTDSGMWQFSADSIAALPAIWELMKDRPVIPGLKDVSEIDFEPSTWLKSRMPEAWLAPFAGLERWQWFGILTLIGVTAIFSFLVKEIVRRSLDRRAKNGDDGTLKRSSVHIGRASSWLFAFILIHFGLPFLGLPTYIHTPLLFLVTVGLYMAIGWFLFGVLDRMINFAARKAAAISDKGQRLVAPVAAKLGRALIAIGVLIAMFSAFGVNVTALVAGLGIGGLVLALAAKDSVENLFGSFTILMEMPFGIGDWVKIGDVEGVVEEINLRSTRIRTFSDSIIVLPNKNLITAAMENMGARRRRQFKTDLLVDPHSTATQVRDLCRRIEEELKENPGIDNDSAYCNLHNFGENSFRVLLSCYITAPDYGEELRVRQDVLTKIIEISDEMGVGVATPVRAVQIEPAANLTKANASNP